MMVERKPPRAKTAEQLRKMKEARKIKIVPNVDIRNYMVKVPQQRMPRACAQAAHE